MKITVNRRFLPLIILACAGLIAAFLLITSPTTRNQEPAKPVPAVVTVPLEKGEYDLIVEAFGSVIPAREVSITPEVTGKIVYVNPEMEPGGVLGEGDLLVSIEKADYELAVERAAAALREAEAALELEKGRQVVAKREWEIFGKDIDSSIASGELAMRKPQLAQAEADVKSAKAALGEAELNLRRTDLRAPFDSIVLEESVEVGQRVGPDSGIARLAGTGSFWVKASVPLDSFRRIEPEENGDGSAVTIYLDSGLDGTAVRCGKVIRKLGDLDPQGRMGKLLISIEDPLSLGGEQDGRAVPIESYVRTEIRAGTMKDVYRIPRRGLRENNTVWVAEKDGKLGIREVSVSRRYRDEVYVNGSFEPGDSLIVSHLASVIPGMEVNVRDGGGVPGERVASAEDDPKCGKE